MRSKSLISWIAMIAAPLCVALWLVFEYNENMQIAQQRRFYSETLRNISKNVKEANISLLEKMCEMDGFEDIDYQLSKYVEAQDIYVKVFQSQLVLDVKYKVLEEDKVISSLRLLDNDMRLLKDMAGKWMKAVNMAGLRQDRLDSVGKVYAVNVYQFAKYDESFTASLAEVETQVYKYFNRKEANLNTRIIISLVVLFCILMVYCYNFVRARVTIQRLNREIEKAKSATITQGTEIINFVREIINENFNVELRGFNQDEVFAKTLNALKNKLKSAADTFQVQQVETERRTWNTHGLALFSEIMRDNTQTLNELSYKLVSNLVKYLKANQGGIFILNEEDKNDIYLELAGFYAFERRKYANKQIKPGEGLVGMCFLERKTTILNEVPEDYILIKSGLGDAPPKSIAIVPLALNEDIYGVIEIASFSQFERYQIEFVEKLGESICATIKNIKISRQTERLLEVSRQQGESMRAQEEEMMQNLEELSATQEEMERKGLREKEAFDKLMLEKEKLLSDIRNKTLSFEQKTADMAKREAQMREKITKLENTIKELRRV